MKKLTWTILWSWFEFKTPRALLLIPKKLDFAFDHRSRAAIVLLSSSLIFSPDFLFLPLTSFVFVVNTKERLRDFARKSSGKKTAEFLSISSFVLAWLHFNHVVSCCRTYSLLPIPIPVHVTAICPPAFSFKISFLLSSTWR